MSCSLLVIREGSGKVVGAELVAYVWNLILGLLELLEVGVYALTMVVACDVFSQD